MQRKIYIENIPREQALQKFLQALEQENYFKIESEEVDVLSSHGRITSQSVYAHRSSPHYVASAMDGIAVKASSTFAANEVNPINLKKDQDYIEVDTGDYVPRQFDAVIMIEEVNFLDGYAQIIKPAVPWQHIRSVGEDLVTHDMMVPVFTRLGPYEIASIHTAGVEKIPKNRVAIIPRYQLEERRLIWKQVKS